MILMKWIIKERIGNIIDIAIFSHSTGYLYPTSNMKNIDNKDVNIEAIIMCQSRSFE